ncbi:hypothetical protein DL96DRAFT_1595929 [Flagelloscypha sp. PMI_526]|nr:hypothetical protein DL96DRAFT_1595929 [Flagelloscypha sp. PMI_526]
MDAINQVFASGLEPTLPFSLSFLDIAGAFRLCLILRQLRTAFAASKHASEHETRSWLRSAATTLTVVFGGEALLFPILGIIPGWLISPIPFVLFAAVQALVDAIPSSIIPQISWKTELAHQDPRVADSPFALVFASFVIANGGFFLTGLFSLLHPTSLAFRTPPELMPYGWLTIDLWAAPLITGLYAFLTNAQPGLTNAVWWYLEDNVHVHVESATGKGYPLSPKDAQTFCGVLLVGVFVTRTLVNLGPRPSFSFKVKASPDHSPAGSTDKLVKKKHWNKASKVKPH